MLRLPAHRMTTATVSGAYPFLAEGGLGAEGIFIGRDVHAEAAFCYDPFSLYSSGRIEGFTNPNAVLAGIIGMGKSALAKSIATRAIAHGYRVYVPCDPKGEWTAVSQALGGYSIALGPGLPGRLNPLDAPARPASVSEGDWVTEVRKRRLLLLAGLARTVLKRDLLPMEHTALDLALDLIVAEAAADGTVPLLGEIAHALGSPERLDRALGDQAGRMGPAAQDLAHALHAARARRLERHVRRSLDGGLRPDHADAVHRPLPPRRLRRRHRLGPRDDLRERVDGVRARRPGRRATLGDLRRGVAGHEARRPAGAHAVPVEALPRARHREPHGHPPPQRPAQRRRCRPRGRVLAEGLLADCSTRIIYRQEPDQLAAAASLLGLTGVETQAVSALTKGRGLWKVAGRSFITQHILHPAERELFDTDARMSA